MANVGQTQVGSRPQFGAPKNTGTLTEADLADEDNEFPIFDADMDNRAALQHLIYVINFTGIPQRFLATPLDVQIKGEEEAEPTNYDMEVDQTLEHREFFAFPVPNVIWVSWSVNGQPNMYRTGEPSFTIADPNGHTLEFYLRNGKVSKTITDTANLVPNALRIVNSIGKEKILVSIFTTDPCKRDPRRKLLPDWQANVTNDEHFDYVHIVDYTCWIAQCFDIAPRGADETVVPSKSVMARQGNTRRFQVASIKWWDVVQEVPPGTYIIMVLGDSDASSRYKLIPFEFRGLHLIRKSQYYGSVEMGGFSTRAPVY
jgi:hypothetical protein